MTRWRSSVSLLAVVLPACGPEEQLSLGALPSDSNDAGATIGADGDDSPPVGPLDDAHSCSGLQCLVDRDCPIGQSTKLSGTVFDPAGLNALHGVTVYVPVDPQGRLPALPSGTSSCRPCDASIGAHVALTVTDAKGRFELVDVPAGARIPLVFQVGKWRREVLLPQVARCGDNSVPPSLSRLPRSRAEGDLPQMAVLTGGDDDLACLLSSIGVDPAEFSGPHGGGRLDVYQGMGGAALSSGSAGNCTTSGCPLWSSRQSLEYYDVVLLSCEGAEYTMTKPWTSFQAMHDWLGEGGTLVATHLQYTWFKNGPGDFAGIASWRPPSPASGSGNYAVDTTAPDGRELGDWLGAEGALTGDVVALRGVASSVAAVNAPGVRLIYDLATNDVAYLSFRTPIELGQSAGATGALEGSPQTCGRAIFADVHAAVPMVGPVPVACSAGPLTPQQKALEFLLFGAPGCSSAPNLPQNP